MSETENKVGAPSKFTPETQNKILFAIERGATYELAADFAGISYNTFNNWMKRGKEQEGQEDDSTIQVADEYFEFYKAVKKSASTAALFWLDKIDAAAKEGNWQAAAWKLERRYPQMYGKTVQEVQGKDGGPIEYANLTPDERLDRANQILNQARARRVSDTNGSD